MDTSAQSVKPNPREKASAFSVLVWWWTVGVFRRGYSNVLTIDDLFNPLEKDRSSYLGDRLEKQWSSQLSKFAQPNLLKTIFLTFRKEIFAMGLLHVFVEFVLRLGSPILLGLLLRYFKRDTTTTYEQALVYALALVLSNVLALIVSNHCIFLANHLGGRIRIALRSLVYRKSLKLSKAAVGETAAGKIVNLLANDANRFDVVMILLHYTWTAPLSTLAVACFLYLETGVVGLIGIAVLLAALPIQVYSGKLSSKYRLLTAGKTDERLRLISEMISGVQVIKLYAWERPFCQLAELARSAELSLVRKTSMLRGLFVSLLLFTSRAALCSSLLLMLDHEQALSPERLFVFSSFYGLVATSMTSMFARGLAEIAECRVSVSRIQAFMMLDEYRPANVHRLPAGKSAAGAEHLHGNDDNRLPNEDYKSHGVILNNVTAKWSRNLADRALSCPSLTLESGKLYGLIGGVGSGKSSLLAALLGELSLSAGGVILRGRTSHAEQEAWLFGSSIRQNILLGEPFDRQRYQRVVKACALQQDLGQLPEGDGSLVAERGASLSGGQKARISLARAVYRQADVYLLDDPLSAVDARVAKHLFDDCITRYLEGKTRILATHQLQYVKDVDGIILMDQGRAKYFKDYAKLVEAHPEYRSLMNSAKDEQTPESYGHGNVQLPRRLSYVRLKSRTSEKGDSEILEEEDKLADLKDRLEKTSKGAVEGGIFLRYFYAGSNAYATFVMIGLFLLAQLCVSLNDLSVSLLVNAEEARSANETSSTLAASYPREYYVYAYASNVAAILAIGMARSWLFYALCLRSSERLHNAALRSIIRASLRFFDLNPSGRIINRFSKDTSTVDVQLPLAILDSSQVILGVAGVAVLVCLVQPIFILFVCVIGVLCYWFRRVYLKTSRNIKRLEGMTRSPVFTHLNATLDGISTIRAYGVQDILKREFDKFQDLHTSSWYLHTACSLAFAFALDIVTATFTTSMIFTFLLFKDHFDVGEVGLAITQMTTIAGMIQWGMRQSAAVSNHMTSVERLLEYTQIPAETNSDVPGIREKELKLGRKRSSTIKSLEPSLADWPSSGAIEFRHVFMRYAEDEPPVLKDLCFSIKPSEKVGIVGRTGAGKSSLITALFRLAPLEGVVKIDGVDTGTLGLECLRSRMSIIPQDPVLFSGTMRRNLDPFDEYDDEDLWRALEEVELKDVITGLAGGLNCRLLDRGSNFSVGQRQLVCLARAVLRNHKVLMLDEATANVDPQTDALIQRTIRVKFAKCTVLTVAHRLNTIIDSDRVIVMDKGRLIEFDHPYQLLQREKGEFTSLLTETGEMTFRQLYAQAKNCYYDKYVETRC